MYWINVIAQLLKVSNETASAIFEQMNYFDFSEASDSQIKREAKIILRSMKA
jgi:hypothetical protein